MKQQRENKISNKRKRRFFLGCLIIIGILIGGCGKKDLVLAEDAGSSASFPKQEEAEEKPQDPPAEGENLPELRVYICGAVKNEGVYCLPAGSIVADGLSLAGGYREDAANGYVNLAKELWDNEQVYFPTREEVAGMSIPSVENAPDIRETQTDGKINLNTAGKEELMQLPGIGEQKAEDIIKYRQEQGPFRETEELMNISGIKEGTFQKLAEFITVS